MPERLSCGDCSEASASALVSIDERARARFEALLIRLSARLASAHWQKIGAEVDLGLNALLEFGCVDQASVFQVLEGPRAYLRHVASVPGMQPMPGQLSYGEWFPWAFSKVVLGTEVLACSLEHELPPEALTDKASMRALGVRALLHIPLEVEGKVRFVLTVGRRERRSRLWSEQCVARLKTLGEMFAHAISRAAAVGALAASQHDVRDTLELAHLGHWEWDIGADRLQLSDEAKHILGADVQCLERLVQLVQPVDRPVFEQAIARARARPGVRVEARYAVQTPAGEVRTIHQWHEVMFPGERTARLIATIQDVTSVLETEQEVNALREREWHSARVAQTTLLVASLAHELCQPLAAMLNNAQAGLRFLANGNIAPGEMRDILTDIVASNRKASEVLGALRAMLRRQQTTRVTFDAVDAVHDVLALVRSELMSEEIEVETVLEPECYMNADKTQIEQVLLNLIMNSIDAMRDQRERPRFMRLAVCLPEGSHVDVSVMDSGRGIPGDKRPKIFEAFWTTKEKGLGMGLPLCRAIVESYGGRIWCEDNDAGGVTFRFRLPAVSPEAERLYGSAAPRSLESAAVNMSMDR